MIEITEVRVSLRNDEKLKAFVSITLNDSFVVRGLKIIKGNSGLFVAMPSRKRPDGQHQDLAHPINDVTRKYLTDKVMTEYERELANPGPRAALTARPPDGSAATRFSPADCFHGPIASTPGGRKAERTVTEIPFCWWGVAKR